MRLEDIATSISEIPRSEGMDIIKKSRVSRHKKPKRYKNRGSKKRKKPKSLDDIFKALNTDESWEMIRKLEKIKRKNNG